MGETVGGLTTPPQVQPRALTASRALSSRRIASRVGSAAAWSRRTSGSVWRFISTTVLTDIYIVKYQYV